MVMSIPPSHYVTARDARTRGSHRPRAILSPNDVFKYSFFSRTVRQLNNFLTETTRATSVEKVLA